MGRIKGIKKGPAYWKNKDYDVPIEIIDYYGEVDGRHYVRAVDMEGNQTGIPLDEIEYYTERYKTVAERLRAAYPDQSDEWINKKIHDIAKDADARRVNIKSIIDEYINPGASSVKAEVMDAAPKVETTGTKPKVETKNVDEVIKETAKTADKIDDAADAAKAMTKTNKSAEALKKNAKLIDTLQDQYGISAAKGVSDWAGKAGLIAGGIILAGALVQAGLDWQEKQRTRKMESIQRKNTRRLEKEMKFDKDIYYDAIQRYNEDVPDIKVLDQYVGLPQKLYANRIGHTNTWGGVRY